jgi:GntR family negative regulator for fad regulon and positive regulator of fabA
MNWNAPEKPAEFAENRLIQAIISGHFPINSNLPAERELAAQLGVTRPTLREALQRIARDGWIEIRHGKPTRVRNYWQEGNLGVLSAITRQVDLIPKNFVPNLLFVRRLLAPSYTRLSIENSPGEVVDFLSAHSDIGDSPEAFADFDWRLHHKLTIFSNNPIFTLILNGFKDLYYPMACLYFQSQITRSNSKEFYAELLDTAMIPDPQKAEDITERVMQNSLDLWKQIDNNQ